MILRIPVTASNIVEWVRRAATAVNALILGQVSLESRATALEAFEATATTDIAALDGRVTALEGRADALEAFTALPFTVASITLPPAALPASPAHGMLATDVADGKVKFYDGSIWNALY